VRIKVSGFRSLDETCVKFVLDLLRYVFAGTASLGPRAAMACTVAVESVIVEHYNDQLRQLMADDKNNEELLNVIKQFRDEEQEHHDIGIEQEAEKAFLYDYLSGIIRTGSKFAIAVAKVI